MLVREEQSLNAPFPIFSSVDGNVKLIRFEQPEKAPSAEAFAEAEEKAAGTQTKTESEDRNDPKKAINPEPAFIRTLAPGTMRKMVLTNIPLFYN